MIRSRFPGSAGGRRVRLSLDLGPNILAPAPGAAGQGSPLGHQPYVLRTLKPYDVVWVSQVASPPAAPGQRAGRFYIATSTETADGIDWTFTDANGQPPLTFHVDSSDPKFSDEVRKVTVTVSVFPSLADDPEGLPQVWSGLALDPQHTSFGAYDSLTYQFHARTRKPRAGGGAYPSSSAQNRRRCY